MKVIAWLSLVVLIGSFLCRPFADPDLWWHIVVGRWIVAHRDVPHVDYWNMFGVGQPWRAYSWSNELVYALIDSWYKETGLVVLQLVLGCALAASIIWISGSLAGDYFLGMLPAVLTVVTCRSHFSLRPQTVVWILFAWVLWMAEMARRRGANRGFLLGAFCVGSAWANTHISAVFGVLALAFWSLSWRAYRGEFIRIAFLLSSFVAGTFVSPYLGGEWLTLFSKSDHIFAFRSLDEFKPADLTQVPTLCVLFQIIILAILSFSANRLPPLGGMIVTGVSVLIAGLAVKFMPFACIAVGILTAVWLNGVSANYTEASKRNRLLDSFFMLRRFLYSRQAQTLGACVFFIGCIAWINIARINKRPINYSAIPWRAVDFVEAQSLQHPVLNDFSSGGYLEYRWSTPQGTPTHLVPIDGRTNVNRRDIWDSYLNAFQGREQWREYLDKVKPHTIIWANGSPLSALLLEAPDWCRVFESGKRPNDYSVFITRAEFDQRSGEFTASDCVSSEKGCKDLCGDGVCQEIVCMAVGCPCPESHTSCPVDCK